MNGDDGWREHARELGVRYLFWGARGSRALQASRASRGRTAAALIATGEWGTIYDLQKPAVELPEREM